MALQPFEEQVDRQRNSARLCDCPLPAGVRLRDRTPVQRRMGGLLHRSFAIVFNDPRMGEIEHIERFDIGVPDHIQMQFALRTLKGKLDRLGIRVDGAHWGRAMKGQPKPRLFVPNNAVAHAAAQLDAHGIGRSA